MNLSAVDMKREIRRDSLARRDAIAPDLRIEKSLAIAEHGAAIDAGTQNTLSGFVPIRSEADPRPLMFALGQKGARLCLPAVLDRETIVFRELVRGAAVVDTGFGTIGPDDTAAVLDPDIMLVPLAAFDRHGHRIGYGAGHYDRAIARLHANGTRPRLVGVAFSCQETEAVPAQAHDVPLDAIVTEDGLRDFAVLT